MAATLRELRGRIRSAGSIKKITKAQEMIATSRIAKAQARVWRLPALRRRDHQHADRTAGASALDHPLLVAREQPAAGRCAGGVVRPRDCAARYNANMFRRAEELFSLLRPEGKTPIVYAVGPKSIGLLQVPQLEDDRFVERVLRAAGGTRTLRRSRRRWSKRSWPEPTTTVTIRARTGSSASTNCTSCSPSSSR